MGRDEKNQDNFELEGPDLQRKLEKLLSWARTHTELGQDMLEPHSTDEHEALKRCFARSLELGREIMSSCESGLKTRTFVKAELTRPRIEPPRRDLILPLSGSMRFVDPGVSLGLAQPKSEDSSTRRFPLSPSRSYSKKKAY